MGLREKGSGGSGLTGANTAPYRRISSEGLSLIETKATGDKKNDT